MHVEMAHLTTKWDDDTAAWIARRAERIERRLGRLGSGEARLDGRVQQAGHGHVECELRMYGPGVALAAHAQGRTPGEAVGAALTSLDRQVIRLHERVAHRGAA